MRESKKNGFCIELQCQPANSPDFNVLDLGFFNSIQSLQYEEAPTTIDELISSVENAFWKLDRLTLDNVFVSLQKCMEAAMLDRGGNSYPLPHMQKAKLRNLEKFPRRIQCYSVRVKLSKSRTRF